MAKKKRKIVHKAERKKVTREPEYTISISEAKMLRKNILEGLREVILFMQSYEKFKRIQEEKVIQFAKLKSDVKELHSLIDNKLRGFIPKGKLHASHISDLKKDDEEQKVDSKPKKLVSSLPEVPRIVEGQSPATELDELESQLKNIENQLQDIN